MEDIVILIPAYKPEKEIMMDFIKDLHKKFENIVIVDDGSGKEYSEFFTELENLGLKIIYHDVNKGKGRALKTGTEFILQKYDDILGIVTADCDGQHCVEDIEKCAIKLREYPDTLVLGCRDFDDPQVPPRSKFGNKLTRGVFKAFIGLNITDTQSGLRAYGPDLMKKFLNTKGERYEYETNTLIDCKTYDIEIKEVTIQTVYIKNNEGSHFNPIKDSIRIYKLFLKYILASASSFLIDITLFTIFVNILQIDNRIMIATILARIISSIYNFVVNAKLVFKKKNKTSIIRYFILVIVQMFISGMGVTFIANNTHINETVIKVIVDIIIFIANFIIQREWVFKK